MNRAEVEKVMRESAMNLNDGLLLTPNSAADVAMRLLEEQYDATVALTNKESEQLEKHHDAQYPGETCPRCGEKKS